MSRTYISGAFGIKFGDTFDTGRSEFSKGINKYAIKPDRPYYLFEYYYVSVLNNSNKIIGIVAEAAVDVDDVHEEYLRLIDNLRNEYGQEVYYSPDLFILISDGACIVVNVDYENGDIEIMYSDSNSTNSNRETNPITGDDVTGL